MCPHCGHPVWVCQSNNRWLAWTVSDYVCAAEVAKHDKSSKDEPGHYKVARPKMRKSDLPMPTREDYFAQIDEEVKIHSKADRK